MDDNVIKISLVSNAGLLIQIGGSKILLDALWAEGEAYSAPPLDIKRQMLTANSANKWRNADYVMFTHLHSDHFEQRTVVEYLQHNKVRSVWFDRQDSVADTAYLREYMANNHIECQTFELQHGTHKTIQLEGNIAITAIGTQHMGTHARQDHIALVLHAAGKHLLFVADAEFPLPIFKQALGDIKPDAVFLNPVHFYSRKALHMVVAGLQAKQIVAYHIPFADEGNSVFRRMISKKMPLVSAQIPVQILWNVGDCVEIG